jgi:tetratricopeptide (TPR) repeat protein
MGNYRNALSDFDQALRLAPQMASARISAFLGENSLNELRSSVRTLDLLDQSIESDPENPEYYFKRANLYSQLGNLSKALSDYDKTIILFPDFAPAYASRAFTNLLLGNEDSVQPDIDKAVDLGLDREQIEAQISIVTANLQNETQPE